MVRVGKNEQMRLRHLLRDAPGNLDTVENINVYVENHELRRQAPDNLAGSHAVGGFADNLKNFRYYALQPETYEFVAFADNSLWAKCRVPGGLLNRFQGNLHDLVCYRYLPANNVSLTNFIEPLF